MPAAFCRAESPPLVSVEVCPFSFSVTGTVVDFVSVKVLVALEEDATAVSAPRVLARVYRVVVKLRETFSIRGICWNY